MLRGRIDEGGMGTVYYGITSDGDELAVKTIQDRYVNRPDLRSRFEREVEAMGMVQGPRVANLIAAAASGEPRPWLASEYIRGLTLTQYVAEHGTLPSALVAAALGVAALAEAIASIHRAGVLHRDLKPGNIILGLGGPRVIDFGLAVLTDRPGHLTVTNDVLGTPACMSPEQAISSRDVTAATDVYALGATLTFAMAKALPVPGGDRTRYAERHHRPRSRTGPVGHPGRPAPRYLRHARICRGGPANGRRGARGTGQDPRRRRRDRPGRRHLALGRGHLPEQPRCPRAPANHPAAAAVAGSGRRPARPKRARQAGCRPAPPRLRRIGILLATTLTTG